MRKVLTPGRLYTTLSAEFRRLRCADCANCVLPVPVPVALPGDDDPSWKLEELPHLCKPCERAIRDVVRRAQARYDLLDPLSPVFSFRSVQRSGPSPGDRKH
jgi:hypothetical protein